MREAWLPGLTTGLLHSPAQPLASVTTLATMTSITAPAPMQDHYSEVRERLVAAVKALKSGDPRQEDTFIGPLISDKEAQRVQDWVSEAVARGLKPAAALCMHLGESRPSTHDIAQSVLLSLGLAAHRCS